MIQIETDLALAIALHPGTTPMVAFALLAAERADANGEAHFEPGELAELLSKPDGYRPKSGYLKTLITQAVHYGYLGHGSTRTRLLLPAGITVSH